MVPRRAACLTAATLLILVRPIVAAQAPGSSPIAGAQPQPNPIPVARTRGPLDERERAIHLLSRTTYGVREQDVEEVLRIGREAWLDRQLAAEYPPPIPGGMELNPRAEPAKLVTNFVSYDPPAELVQELECVFLGTGGDLRAVTRALFLSEAFYDPEHYRQKVKRPFEFVASALRTSGFEHVPESATGPQLRELFAYPLFAFGHHPYGKREPTGYPTDSEEWVSSGAMLDRMNYARRPSTRTDPRGSGPTSGVALRGPRRAGAFARARLPRVPALLNVGSEGDPRWTKRYG